MIRLLVAAALASAAESQVSIPCSPQKACDFVKQWNAVAGGEKISLVCKPEDDCTISGRLGGGGGQKFPGFQGNATMANVLLQNGGSVGKSGKPGSGFGGLMNVGGDFATSNSGSVTGTNLTFRNGTASNAGGCVYNDGTFACTDCVFDKCTAADVRAQRAASSLTSHAARRPSPRLTQPTPACRTAEEYSATSAP